MKRKKLQKYIIYGSKEIIEEKVKQKGEKGDTKAKEQLNEANTIK